jgi:hypothetical protein
MLREDKGEDKGIVMEHVECVTDPHTGLLRPVVTIEAQVRATERNARHWQAKLKNELPSGLFSGRLRRTVRDSYLSSLRSCNTSLAQYRLFDLGRLALQEPRPGRAVGPARR